MQLLKKRIPMMVIAWSNLLSRNASIHKYRPKPKITYLVLFYKTLYIVIFSVTLQRQTVQMILYITPVNSYPVPYYKMAPSSFLYGCSCKEHELQ